MSSRPIPSGTRVIADGWLRTRILGANWCQVRQTWSYRIDADRSRQRGQVLFHACATDLEVLI